MRASFMFGSALTLAACTVGIGLALSGCSTAHAAEGAAHAAVTETPDAGPTPAAVFGPVKYNCTMPGGGVTAAISLDTQSLVLVAHVVTTAGSEVPVEFTARMNVTVTDGFPLNNSRDRHVVYNAPFRTSGIDYYFQFDATDLSFIAPYAGELTCTRVAD